MLPALRSSRPQFQILAGGAGHLPAAADRPVSADLFARRELHAHRHDGHGHVLRGVLQLRQPVQGRAAVVVAGPHAADHRDRASDRTDARPRHGLSVSREACRAARSSFRFWCCPPSFRPSSRAPHGGCCSTTAMARSTRSSAGSRASASTRCGPSIRTLVYPAIIFCEIWQWTPFMFLILLAALSNVDKSQTEAAEIDGAALLAHLPLHRVAGHLAGDGHRHPHPRPRSVPHLRHHLGADPGRARHHDRDHFDLCLCRRASSSSRRAIRRPSPFLSSSS